MNRNSAAVLGGLIGGVVVSLVMIGGRKTGTLHETLDKKSEEWLDRNASTRSLVGDSGTMAIEQANHAVASAAFGYGYGIVRDLLPRSSPALVGTLYGTVLYVTNIVAIAPVLGITEGERRASGRVRTERLGLHVLFGLITALVTDGASERRRRA